jgi:sulfite reductase beta subunit-like hemoprotein
MRGQAVDRVEAAAQVMRDWIKGQEAASRVDDAMKVLADWVEARQRLNDRIRYEQ